MQYYRLYELNNQYPSIGNYITRTPGTVNLYGVYSETNVLPIEIKQLDGLKYVKGTNFRFIAKIKEKETDTVGKLYTSEKYFKNLEASIKESNPYFVNDSFNEVFIVEIFLDSFVSLFQSLVPKENSAGVSVFKNNFINKDKSIDYDAFVKYLDWIVSTPKLEEVDTNGVIRPELLIDFKTFEIDHEKAYFYPNELQTPETNGGFSQTESPSAQANQLRLQKIAEIQEELNNVNADISLYAGFIADDDYPNSGLSESTLVVTGKIEEKKYVSGKHFLNRRKQNEDIRNQLISYSNELKSRKNSLETELNKLSYEVTSPTPPANVVTIPPSTSPANPPNRGINIGQRNNR